MDGTEQEAVGSSVAVGGYFTLECFAPDGTLRWAEDLDNGVCNAALDDLLNTYLRNGTPKTAWYAMLIDNAGFTALAAADTMSSHAGWAENTSYTETVRQTWTPGASSGQVVTNGTAMTFTVNATIVLRGAAVSSANDKGGTTGLLLCTAAFGTGNQSANSGDSLKLTYNFTAAST